jgi:hypothetical protein
LVIWVTTGPLENERCQKREDAESRDNATFQVGKSLGV